jgi:ABC-type transport system involved in cytochrome c biogenesis permease subunit
VHKKLKAKKALPDVNGGAPALATVERINNFVVLVGFPLFTIWLLTGFAWAYLARGAVFTSDPKEIASVLLWLFYAFVFLQRVVFCWQGRKGAIMLVALFTATLCSILGVNLFMNSHYNFFQTPMF